MGRARAFTAKVVMLRGRPTARVGTIRIDGLGYWRLLWLQSNCLYGRVRTRWRRLEASARPVGRIIKIGELMERLAVCPAVISLLFLISSLSAFAGDQPGFSIKVFTSPDDQF